jgi:hypothetical protein
MRSNLTMNSNKCFKSSELRLFADISWTHLKQNKSNNCIMRSLTNSIIISTQKNRNSTINWQSKHHICVWNKSHKGFKSRSAIFFSLTLLGEQIVIPGNSISQMG